MEKRRNTEVEQSLRAAAATYRKAAAAAFSQSDDAEALKLRADAEKIEALAKALTPIYVLTRGAR